MGEEEFSSEAEVGEEEFSSEVEVVEEEFSSEALAGAEAKPATEVAKLMQIK